MRHIIKTIRHSIHWDINGGIILYSTTAKCEVPSVYYCRLADSTVLKRKFTPNGFSNFDENRTALLPPSAERHKIPPFISGIGNASDIGMKIDNELRKP